MKDKIFISYRRQDAKADARSIYQRLERTFGAKRLFMDVDTIQRGADFRRVLERHLEQSSVLLALIGPGWLSVDAQGRRRLDDPADCVRMEIANALKSGISVVPILLDGAKMPDASELPDDVRDLVYRQAARVSHDNFPRDMDSIERDLKRMRHSERSSLLPISVGICSILTIVGGAAFYLWPSSMGSLPPQIAKIDAARPSETAPAVGVAPPIASAESRQRPNIENKPEAKTTAKPPVPLPTAKTATAPTAPQASTPQASSVVTGRLLTASAVRAEEYRIVRNLSVEACTAECERDQRCRMFSHWYSATCYLFDRNYETYPTPASVTGSVATRAR